TSDGEPLARFTCQTVRSVRGRIIYNDQVRAKARRELFRGCFSSLRRLARIRNGWRWHLELSCVDLFSRRWRRRRRGYLDHLRHRSFRLWLALAHEGRWPEGRGRELLVSFKHIARRRLPAGNDHIASNDAEQDQKGADDE